MRRWDADDKGHKFDGGINDVVVTGNGGAYATVFGPPEDLPTEVAGKILYLAPGAKNWIEVARDLNYANGVGVSPDQKTLYVSETVGNCILKFTVNADGTVNAPIAGKLYLTINADSMQTPDGSYTVHIDRTPTSAATASGAAASQGNYDFKPLFAELDAKLPYRVTDQPSGGNPGDLVNFIIVGSQDQVTNALKAAGWIVADKTNGDAVVSALLATLQFIQILLSDVTH